MLLWGAAYWSKRLEDKHINTNHKELLWAKHKKPPFMPECVKTEFERSLKKLHFVSIPISLCLLDTESSFFPSAVQSSKSNGQIYI